MVDIYIGIGSNIEPHHNVKKALEVLEQALPSIEFSRVFESKAVGFEGENFLNLVARFNSRDVINSQTSSDLSKLELSSNLNSGKHSLNSVIQLLKELESQLGRVKGSKKFSDRLIDIDVLLWGDLQLDSPIELPRGEILQNAYVLWPLSELAPNMIHPGTSESYQALWSKFDKSKQQLNPVQF
ncbi:MAG: 2-amino-4-hydroxy-6-hydroxymethyldihydropteridine diphosphokinase [Kangiellaceae bacterium]|nr:2-amino-4-hydroxy-6-hydroxymethyldihydropteridine diphosphokinase [Kangiellaceae bacterium]